MSDRLYDITVVSYDFRKKVRYMVKPRFRWLPPTEKAKPGEVVWGRDETQESPLAQLACVLLDLPLRTPIDQALQARQQTVEKQVDIAVVDCRDSCSTIAAAILCGIDLPLEVIEAARTHYLHGFETAIQMAGGQVIKAYLRYITTHPQDENWLIRALEFWQALPELYAKGYITMLAQDFDWAQLRLAITDSQESVYNDACMLTIGDSWRLTSAGHTLLRRDISGTWIVQDPEGPRWYEIWGFTDRGNATLEAVCKALWKQEIQVMTEIGEGLVNESQVMRASRWAVSTKHAGLYRLTKFDEHGSFLQPEVVAETIHSFWELAELPEE